MMSASTGARQPRTELATKARTLRPTRWKPLVGKNEGRHSRVIK